MLATEKMVYTSGMHMSVRAGMMSAVCVGVLCASLFSVSSAAEPKKDKLDPQCKKEEQTEMKKCSQWTDKAKKTECEKAAKRDAFEVLVLKNTGKQITEKTDLTKEVKEGHYCVQEKKIAARYGEKCGACPKGVAVLSRSVSKDYKGEICNPNEKDYIVVCREDVETKKEEVKKNDEKKDSPAIGKSPGEQEGNKVNRTRKLSREEAQAHVGVPETGKASRYGDAGDTRAGSVVTSSGAYRDNAKYSMAREGGSEEK
jgi:hypothetical protein